MSKVSVLSQNTRIAITVCAGLSIALTACRTMDLTADGVAIVPFESRAEPRSTYDLGSATLRFQTEAWTNRMPGPAPRGQDAAGFPLHVAVRVELVGQVDARAELNVKALSLWSVDGDSLWAAFALERPDGSAPVLRPGDAGTVWELTDDRDRPRFALIAENAVAVPMLLIVQDSRQRTIRLPEIQVIAAY